MVALPTAASYPGAPAPNPATGLPLVANAPLHALALGNGHAALLVERLEGFGEIRRQRLDQRAVQCQLDEGPHHLHVLGVGRHRVAAGRGRTQLCAGAVARMTTISSVASSPSSRPRSRSIPIRSLIR